MVLIKTIILVLHVTQLALNVHQLLNVLLALQILYYKVLFANNNVMMDIILIMVLVLLVLLPVLNVMMLIHVLNVLMDTN